MRAPSAAGRLRPHRRTRPWWVMLPRDGPWGEKVTRSDPPGPRDAAAQVAGSSPPTIATSPARASSASPPAMLDVYGATGAADPGEVLAPRWGPWRFPAGAAGRSARGPGRLWGGDGPGGGVDCRPPAWPGGLRPYGGGEDLRCPAADCAAPAELDLPGAV